MKFETIDAARTAFNKSSHGSSENIEAFNFLFDNDPEFMREEKTQIKEIFTRVKSSHCDKDGHKCYDIDDISRTFGINVEVLENGQNQFSKLLGQRKPFFRKGEKNGLNRIQ